MAEQFNYDLTVMREASGQLKRLRNDIMILKGKLEETPGQAESFWIGSAGRAFLERSRELIQNTARYCDNIERTEEVLTEAIQTYRQQENQQVNQVSQLDPTSIF